MVEILHRNSPSTPRLVIAALLGVVAALTKVTSFAIVLPAGALLTLIHARTSGIKAIIRSGAVTLPSLIAAVAWTRYTDAVKYDHPYADFLTSNNLTT